MPRINLDTADAAELTEILQFLSEWLTRDTGPLGASLENYHTRTIPAANRPA